MPKTVVHSDQVWDPSRVQHPGHTYQQPFVQATRATGATVLFISGQVALDRDGNLIGAGDVAAQARQALTNLRALLEAAGASIADVAKLTVFVRDMRQFARVQEVRAEFWRGMELPASTALEVARLVRDEFLVEIEAYAVMD
jgi:reactive intermediate/imine deaminase